MPDAASDTVLDATGVAKRFGAVQALKNASLQVKAGQVVALMGANGAGKSTFVKILTGVLKPDAGHVRIKGRDSTVANPAGARKWGLVPVYQEPSLIPDLSVADNLRLGDTGLEPFRHWVGELGLPDLDPDALIRSLPLAALRIVDLARALAIEPDVLLLDELTAALPTDLVDRVLTVVRAQADAGRSVIYISHRFTEIAAICDRATVLRDGMTVGDVKIEPGIEDRIVEMMLGGAVAAAVSEERPKKPISTETPRLRVRSLRTGTRLTDVSFDLHKGEVLGVVALEGQGQDELFDVLAGNRRPSAGTVAVDGTPKTFSHPADAIAAGLTLVPGDRAHALLMSRSVRENIAVPLLARIRDWGAIRMDDEAAKVDAAIQTLQIDTRAQGEVRRLSGGNQQKVTIARWIAKGVRTLLLFDPTRGIDIRTKRQIYGLVRDLADQGAAVLFYTSELAEIRLACDRVVVIFNGRVVDIIDARDADEATLMRAAYGLTEKALA
ncbi:sugar ABC transporter ATP-binding protein [Tabrizicola sp.]|uniref:sugar ABC transporter ATP-binding protein n=1 Tax=Tabrizicola sp. TaxID=2005166 RepID=UPI0027366326|nr:sugar ABC transporter ATP-binding protein [Tabrizicola sp.]MDP3196706.1 sugar ABC transporter ATP-binding protein [Tabrizicola sp.]